MIRTTAIEKIRATQRKRRCARADHPHVFVMTLGYSRRGYAEGYLNERMDSLLSAHERAFAHFGGVCQTLLYK